MLATFKSYIDKHSLFGEEEKVLLGISGGIDSMVLFHLFHKANYNFSVAHCNFQLRGEEADKDEELVKQKAKKLEVNFYSNDFNTKEFAKENKLSTQMAARELRYHWFNEIAKEKQYDWIAIASHKSDVLETMLINLTRGTGLAGLHGILPKRDNIIRPMLFATKEEITAFAKKESIAYRDDESNASTKYMRNKIRHKVIPVLKELNPSIENTAAQTAQKIHETELIFKSAVEEKRKEIVQHKSNQWLITINEIKKLNPINTWLYELLSPFGFTISQVENLVENIDSKPGKLFYSNSYQLLIDRENWIISKLKEKENKCTFIDEKTEIVESPLQLHLTKVSAENISITDNKNIALLDFDSITFPLTIRNWEAGDVFSPLGMANQKKVSDYLIDNKIPRTEKDHTFVIESNKKICWLVGHRIANTHKVTENTKQVLKIELKSE